MTASVGFCEKYAWCVEHDTSDGRLEHYGANAKVPLPEGVPAGLGGTSIMTAQVYCSDLHNEPNVWLGVDQYDEMILDAAKVTALIASLDQIRGALVGMRAHLPGGTR